MKTKTQTKEFKQLLTNFTIMSLVLKRKMVLTLSGQGVVGDQHLLSVERGINSRMQIANGLTEADRKEGLHFEVADFHSQMIFLQVLLRVLYFYCIM